MFLVICAVPVHAYNNYEFSTDVYKLYDNFPNHIKRYAYLKCKYNNLSYTMFLAVAYNESRFQTDVEHLNKNGTIDRGLCQINDACFDFLHSRGVLNNKEELFNPYTNIDCYVELMKYHKNYALDDDKALLGYQVGEGAYKYKYGNGTLTNKTHQFVLSIKQLYDTYPRKYSFLRDKFILSNDILIALYSGQKGIGDFNGNYSMQPLWQRNCIYSMFEYRNCHRLWQQI